MKRFDVRIMLEGVLFDANIMLKKGDTRGAFKLLRHKILEIEKIDGSMWGELSW
jgi:hypothetical protein